MKLTLNRIDGLKCPEGRRDMLVFDDKQRGLGVRVTASGGKTYLAQYNWHGQRRIPLGNCNAVSLAQARDTVRAIMGDVARGVDPAAERKKAAVEARRSTPWHAKAAGRWRGEQGPMARPLTAGA
jgi:Arm DNA-binding domain